MKYHRLAVLFAVYTFTLCTFAATKEPAASQEVRELLRGRIEAAGIPPELSVGEEVVHASVMLPRFYERRAYQLVWSDEKGMLPLIEDLLGALEEAYREGLRPQDYHIDKINALLAEVRENRRRKQPLNPRRLIDLELLLTDAFLIYGSHLLSGRINPETIDSEWFANRREADLAEVLQYAIESSEIANVLTSLQPPQPGYGRLREALAGYRAIEVQGGWPAIPQGPKLKKGDRDERVVVLRQRLGVRDDLSADGSMDTSLVFDEAVDTAIRKFQQRHGLEEDGTLGPATLAALNLSAGERVSQITVNLERWRWLPQELGRRHVIVNIADFKLEVTEDRQTVMEMRAIVGKDYRRTPVFSDRMTYLVFCPFWHVPTNIAVQDKLPVIRRDPSYLLNQKMKVFLGWGSETQEVNPDSIDWTRVSARNFPYRLRQDPGPNNALGRVKFMFPNQFNVYLHDTPSRELFTKTVRTFSSGCIRIEKPVELAEYVLRDDPKWSREAIRATLTAWKEQTVRLPEPIPVHLLYWTAWVDKEGVMHFRDDIYGRDKPLYEALREEPPTN